MSRSSAIRPRRAANAPSRTHTGLNRGRQPPASRLGRYAGPPPTASAPRLATAELARSGRPSASWLDWPDHPGAEAAVVGLKDLRSLVGWVDLQRRPGVWGAAAGVWGDIGAGHDELGSLACLEHDESHRLGGERARMGAAGGRVLHDPAAGVEDGHTWVADHRTGSGAGVRQVVAGVAVPAAAPAVARDSLRCEVRQADETPGFVLACVAVDGRARFAVAVVVEVSAGVGALGSRTGGWGGGRAPVGGGRWRPGSGAGALSFRMR